MSPPIRRYLLIGGDNMKRIPITRNINAVYTIKNTVNGKVYVGSSTNLRKRWNEHIKNLMDGVHINDHLQKSWNKYGMKAFEFSVEIEVDNVDELLTLEDRIINKYDSLNPDKGYNLISADRRDISESTREKLSKTSTGRFHTEETKKRISEANSGRVFTEEHKKKLSDAKRGKHLSEQAKKKVSQYQKTREWTSEREKQVLSALEKAHSSTRGSVQSKEVIQKRLESCEHQCTCIDCNAVFLTRSYATKRCINCRKLKDKLERSNYRKRKREEKKNHERCAFIV